MKAIEVCFPNVYQSHIRCSYMLFIWILKVSQNMTKLVILILYMGFRQVLLLLLRMLSSSTKEMFWVLCDSFILWLIFLNLNANSKFCYSEWSHFVPCILIFLVLCACLCSLIDACVHLKLNPLIHIHVCHPHLYLM